MKWKNIDICKTLYFNFYYLPFRSALALPFRVAPGVKISDMGSRNSVVLKSNRQHICIGKDSSFALGGKTCWHIAPDARLEIDGNATFGRGTQLIVDGNLKIGENFYCNANCIINCGREMTIGSHALFGWNVTILDGDGHQIGCNQQFADAYEPVHIGSHVWIASNASVLKGAVIGDDTVVGYGSIVSKPIEKEHILIGGINKILKENIDWRA